MRLWLEVPGRGTYHTIHPHKPGKIRVVFGAAALHDGVSLNSQLNRGSDLMNSLLGVLLRFRQERNVLAVDIKVPVEDVDALRFLWWEDADFRKPPVEYQMVSHILGTKNSLSCANYCLKRTADNNSLFKRIFTLTTC